MLLSLDSVVPLPLESLGRPWADRYHPGAGYQYVLGCGQGRLGLAASKLQLYHVQSTVGQEFQPLSGFHPHLEPLPIQLGNENEKRITFPPLSCRVLSGFVVSVIIRPLSEPRTKPEEAVHHFLYPAQ